MKERPILFTGSNVRALLRDQNPKTKTRRIVNPQRGFHTIFSGLRQMQYPANHWCSMHEDEDLVRCGDVPFWKCPYGQPGDRLWVRENFYCDYSTFANSGALPKVKPEWADGNLYYAADGTCCQQIPECCCAEVGKPKWRPSIHMPRWASRILLEVVSVRVERLQDISEEDAIAEGVERVPGQDFWKDYLGFGDGIHSAQGSFASLWVSINGRESWRANPWVWVVEFKRVTQEVALPA